MPVLAQSGCYSLCLDSNADTAKSGLTFQLGLNATGDWWLGAISGTVGFALDSSGNLALYAEGATGTVTSPDASLNIVGHISNAGTTGDLGGPFVDISAGGGAGDHVTSDLFYGTGTHGQPILGTGYSVGIGGGGASSITYGPTVVSPSINLWNSFMSWLCGWAICGF